MSVAAYVLGDRHAASKLTSVTPSRTLLRSPLLDITLDIYLRVRVATE